MTKIDRRKFIMSAGLAGGALSLAGTAAAGYAAGADKDSYTGYGRTHYGEDQFFNRKKFIVESPTYKREGEPVRIKAVDDIFKRNSEMSRLMFSRGGGNPSWKPEDGIESLPDHLRDYYKTNPGALEEFFRAMEKGREQRAKWPKYRDKYFIADAWSTAHSSPIGGRGAFPAGPLGRPEESDFRGVNKVRLELKSNTHGSELIKKIAYSFGASLVGITEVKKEWVYQGSLRGVGRENFEVPDHWKYAVVIAVPHEWDSMYANPTYGTSYDAYSKLRFIAGKMEVFIKELGYSARSHVPPTSYDLVMPPLAIDAGLGEQGRNGILITPELGANTRLAAVTTDIPLKPDKPIDIGISRFCEKCKICAEECPSGAITLTDKPETVVRGYRRWKIDQNKCFTVWNSVATSHARGCRVCLSVCPYSRKNNWVHGFAREADPRDPTGLVASGLLLMQKKLFNYHGGQEYLPPPDGSNKTFGEAPDWLQTDKWFKI